MGVKHKDTIEAAKARTPGPGEYSADLKSGKNVAPSFGFGSSQRYDPTREKRDIPGPGYHKLPTMISHVP